MSNAIVIRPAPLAGEVTAPPSKSCAHRAIIAAALAAGQSRIGNLEVSDDIAATLEAVRELGAAYTLADTEGGRCEAAITGIEQCPESPVIDCRESGSTLRFMLPVAMAACGQAGFSGSARLAQRPLGPYYSIFKAQGIEWEQGAGGLPLAVRGEFKPGVFAVPPDVSSQFVSGLMLAAPILSGDSYISVQGVLESLPYVDVTIDVLKRFGVAIGEEERGSLYHVPAQEYRAAEYDVEGDWSQAAFLLLMGLLSGPVSVGGLDKKSKQGDKIVEAIFKEMGGDVRWKGGRLTARRSALRGAEVDVSQCPDLAPAVAAAMAVAAGESRITGGARLRAKESDRLQSIEACLNALGADAEAAEDGLVIRGRAGLRGGRAQAFNDHRIAMMAAAVSGACAEPVILEGRESVAKSWPGFWAVFKSLGGDFDE